MNVLGIIGRKSELFHSDMKNLENDLIEIISASRILVIGGAGSIGQAVTLEIFKRNPRLLHVVDTSENNMVELVRRIRSDLGYIEGEFKTFAIDCGSTEFDFMFSNEGPYDYVFNLSALKHVRSEKDPYTLMRLTVVNILNTLKTVQMAKKHGVEKYFCVSTDKAANPVNMMGASKRIMELFMMRESLAQNISLARFANVAFSDGSLLHGFRQRIALGQPISAPSDVTRYFITPKESGELCLLSGLLGQNRDIFFPKSTSDFSLVSFSEIAEAYLDSLGYEAFRCDSEDEARNSAQDLISQKKWPCYFFSSDTTGEKSFEEFFVEGEVLDMQAFETIGVIKNVSVFDDSALNNFLVKLEELRVRGYWSKIELVDLYNTVLPNFAHLETGKYLDQKM